MMPKRLLQFLFAFLLLLPIGAEATIAFDAATSLGSGTGNLTVSHTPVGTPKGVFVFIVQDVSAADRVLTVTYGVLGLTLVGAAVDTAGEPGRVYAYFAGSSIPTGTQTVLVTVSAGGAKFADVITVTAATDTALAGTTGFAAEDENQANPSVTITGQTTATYTAGAVFSGQNDVANVTQDANHTAVEEFDFGSTVGAIVRRNAQLSSGDPVVSWTILDTNCAVIGVAIKQTSEDAAGAVPRRTLMGVGQ